jgi:hypothetical protein
MSLKITECITKTMTILNGKGDVSLVTLLTFLVPLNELVILTSKVSFIKVIDNEMKCTSKHI